MELVKIRNRKPVTDSSIVAQVLGRKHKNIIRAIREVEKLAEATQIGRLTFEPTPFKDEQDKEQIKYVMDRRSFSMLMMHLKGEKVFVWKFKFVKAFEALEHRLRQIELERASTEWQQARLDGKIQRRKETDTIQQFILYAEEQGCKNAKFYYRNFTSLVHKALGCNDGERDKLTDEALSMLASLESVIEIEIPILIDEGLYYKKIYEKCKAKVNAFARVKGLPEQIYLPSEQKPVLEVINK